MTNNQIAAQVAAELTALTNCKEIDDIVDAFNVFFEEIINKLGKESTQPSMTISTGASSPRNIPVVKSQEELKLRLNDYTLASGGAITESMLQSSRPVKKDRPKKHPPKSKGPTIF